jgi:hypothetical protein
MAQMTPHEMQLMARLAQDTQLIGYLEAKAGKQLAALGHCSKDQFEKLQGLYLSTQDFLKDIAGGAEGYRQLSSHQR